jgi:hypothetical protein
VISCSPSEVELESFDDEVLALGMGVEQTLTVDPLNQVFSVKMKMN